MATRIKHRRSSTPAAAPATGDLELGELAINTYDGKLYLKKNDGAAGIDRMTFLDNLTQRTLELPFGR